jgi:hypothetical protein
MKVCNFYGCSINQHGGNKMQPHSLPVILKTDTIEICAHTWECPIHSKWSSFNCSFHCFLVFVPEFSFTVALECWRIWQINEDSYIISNVVGADQIVDESGVAPKKYPPGLRSDDTFLSKRCTVSSLVKQSCHPNLKTNFQTFSRMQDIFCSTHPWV